MHASIASDQIGRMLKELLVMGHRLYRLPMFVGLLQDLVAGHDAPFHLIEHDVAAKLHLGSPLVARDGPRVRLEQTEDFLARGHLPALQHASACLGDDALDQWQHLLGLRTTSLLTCEQASNTSGCGGRRFELDQSTEPPDDLFSIVHNVMDYLCRGLDVLDKAA